MSRLSAKPQVRAAFRCGQMSVPFNSVVVRGQAQAARSGERPPVSAEGRPAPSLDVKRRKVRSMRMPPPGRWKLACWVAVVAAGVIGGMFLPGLAEALAVAASVLAVLAGLSRTESPASQGPERDTLPRARPDHDDLDAEL